MSAVNKSALAAACGKQANALMTITIQKKEKKLWQKTLTKSRRPHPRPPRIRAMALRLHSANIKEMNEGEQAAFKQGAKTVENKVKENLGLKKPKDKQ